MCEAPCPLQVHTWRSQGEREKEEKEEKKKKGRGKGRRYQKQQQQQGQREHRRLMGCGSVDGNYADVYALGPVATVRNS